MKMFSNDCEMPTREFGRGQSEDLFSETAEKSLNQHLSDYPATPLSAHRSSLKQGRGKVNNFLLDSGIFTIQMLQVIINSEAVQHLCHSIRLDHLVVCRTAAGNSWLHKQILEEL